LHQFEGGKNDIMEEFKEVKNQKQLDLIDTFRKNEKQIKLIAKILQKVQPIIPHDSNYSNLDKIQSIAVWNEELQDWTLPEYRRETLSFPMIINETNGDKSIITEKVNIEENKGVIIETNESIATKLVKNALNGIFEKKIFIFKGNKKFYSTVYSFFQWQTEYDEKPNGLVYPKCILCSQTCKIHFGKVANLYHHLKKKIPEHDRFRTWLSCVISSASYQGN